MTRSTASLFFLVLLVGVVACASPPRAVPAASTHAVDAAVIDRNDSARLFDFQSGAWINLHHVLYRHGMKKRGGTPESLRDKHPDGLDDINLGVLSTEERKAWDASVDFYAGSISHRDVVMDDEIIAMSQALSEQGQSNPNKIDRARAAAKAKEAIPADVAEALERVMPIYRARWWSEHDRKNKAWIAIVTPEMKKHGAALAAELSRLFHDEWPSQALRVDVVTYAPPPGAAYTTFGPPHLTISSTDTRNQPPTALEILFHECSHLIIRRVRDAIARELKQQNKNEPSLYHALLFFTSGYAVSKRIPQYQTYGEREGLYHDRWGAYLTAIQEHWVPYLEGRAEFDAAIRDVVTSL
jgi:hypothetical protein